MDVLVIAGTLLTIWVVLAVVCNERKTQNIALEQHLESKRKRLIAERNAPKVEEPIEVG